MADPYLVYLDHPGDLLRGVSQTPKRILYVLSEDDLAEAYFGLEDEQYEVGDRDPNESDYYNLPADVQEAMFDRARDSIEHLFGSDDWSGALTDAIQEAATEQGVELPGQLPLAEPLSKFKGQLTGVKAGPDGIVVLEFNDVEVSNG